jgi:carboxymethylenebutenolidase
MRKVYLILSFIVLLVNTASAQSCCKKPTGNDMKALALNKSFKAAHEAPLPLSYTAKSGEMIHFSTPDGRDGHAFYVPADEPGDKVLFVFHEWWGLNDYIKREAENWQKELGGKVAVYAIDLYDGKVATTADEAGKMANALDEKRGEAIINGLIKKIGSEKKIATIGWCMGGSWSFTGSICAGRQALGCVMYYGFPEKDAARVKSVKSNVLYIYGTQDNFIKKEDAQTFGNILIKSGHGFTFQSYDAPHAFANPSNPKYNAKAAADAHALALAFLKGELSLQ